jgi:AraC-like DNA-binding protein
MPLAMMLVQLEKPSKNGVAHLKRPERPSAPLKESNEQDLSRLTALIKTYSPYDGSFEQKIPGVHTIRRSKINGELVHGLAYAGLCIVAQGSKNVLLGREVFNYDASKMVVYSVDMPLASQVMRASHAEPFLCVRIDLEPQKIAELTLKVYPNGLPSLRENRAVYVGRSDAKITNAAIRLMELIARPEEAELLSSLIIDEILIRLLRSPLGARVAQIGLKDSGLNGVSKAVSWLRHNFTQPVKMENLAKLANMSASTFHAHFKSVTSMSPLQFQKVLRLQEARRLMFSSMMDAGLASQQVGYVSASQFSREYGRFFGGTPTRDIAKLREQMVGVGEV